MSEHDSLVQMLTDAPHVDNDAIEAALKAGLTRRDIEWNQRLDRDWLYRAPDAKAEAAAREGWFVGHGVEPDTAKEYVAAGH